VQLNDVPAGSLNGYWGDVATAVAHEAAGGVRDVILRQSGRAPGEKPGAKTGSEAGIGGAAPNGTKSPTASGRR
jgi:hypothetical protein